MTAAHVRVHGGLRESLRLHVPSPGPQGRPSKSSAQTVARGVDAREVPEKDVKILKKNFAICVGIPTLEIIGRFWGGKQLGNKFSTLIK